MTTSASTALLAAERITSRRHWTPRDVRALQLLIRLTRTKLVSAGARHERIPTPRSGDRREEFSPEIDSDERIRRGLCPLTQVRAPLQVKTCAQRTSMRL